METQLLEKYTQIFLDRNNEPKWATHKIAKGQENELIHCPIPFVGKNYSSQKVKILLYASAENLTNYTGYLDSDKDAINRHRDYFNWSVKNSDSFFPNVHIQPISDGVLPIVALYIYTKFQQVEQITPAEFLEKIAFANYCKYTIQPECQKGHFQNRDYARNTEYIQYSHDYLKADIEILKPDYIIMPKTIYWTDKTFIDQVKGNARIIPIYQMNARNINLRIKNYPQIPFETLNTVFSEWYEHLYSNGISGKTRENFKSVFAYLDDVLQKQQI